MMSGRVGSAISKLGMADNVGVAFGIASQSVSVQKFFPLPVSTSGSVADISGSRCRQMSGRVGSAISKSGMVENVRIAAGIVSPSVSVQKLFSLPVPWPTFRVSDVS